MNVVSKLTHCIDCKDSLEHVPLIVHNSPAMWDEELEVDLGAGEVCQQV